MSLISLFTAILVAMPSLADTECGRPLAPAPHLAAEVAHHAERDLRQRGFPHRQARGYAILIATMVGSAAATTALSASLPNEFQFVSHFLAQVSTLGVYVFGAPIWEPISSRFRKLAFGVRGAHATPGVGDPLLEAQWGRTQEHYSLNAQMSRNVISQFLTSVHQNFFEAYRALTEGRRDYAADQIAEAAFRLRSLFREIDPDDLSVTTAVRASFSRHFVADAGFRTEVEERIRAFDPAYARNPQTRAYYERLLTAWLDEI